MTAVTLTWTIVATVSLTLAAFCVFAWILERRKIAYLMFCVIALATAACAPFELGMMHASTPAEYGRWLRGYHLPIFFVVFSQLLFVYYYLGTGRLWLFVLNIVWRLAILIVNFIVEPNFNFVEISALRQLTFMGEQVSVVAAATTRSLQWMGSVSLLMMTGFVLDAAIRCWRRGDSESRRKSLVIGLGFAGPMLLNVGFNQLLVYGLVQAPIFNILWFLGTLGSAAYKLARDYVINSRASLQVAHLRGELAQLGRVDMLGQIASGLAHELAQPLAATLSNTEAAQRFLQKENPDLGEIRSIVDDINKDAGRAADIIDRMRMLIRRQTVDKQSVAIEEVFRDIASLLHSEAIRRQVELSFKADPRVPHVLGDRVQISQVLLNLLINAMEALEACAAGTKQVHVEASAHPGGGIVIAVTDSGPGIPDDKVEQIFKPLFTTKQKSLGLGLALSRTIIEAHGGRLWAENRSDGGGAVMRLLLPAA
ncbi:MAG TPA: ATP-binding protein [Steroidobacteraceae bacterium]|nr:ATP-binding protein [Steroidobacteraceae bacterium]